MKNLAQAILLLLAVASSSEAQQDFSGTVVDEKGIAVAGALAKLLVANLSDSTDSQGKFTMSGTTGIRLIKGSSEVAGAAGDESDAPRFYNGIGRSIGAGNRSGGKQTFRMVFPISPDAPNGASKAVRLLKASEASIDTLRISKAGYITRSIPVSSYADMRPADTLFSDTTGGGTELQPGACAAATGVRLEAYGGPTNAITIGGAIQFYSDSASIPMDQVTVRYFITNEESSTWTFLSLTSLMMKANATQPGLPVQLVFKKLATPLKGADSYFDFTYQASIQLAPGDQGYLRFELQPADFNPPNQSNGNDYSYPMTGPFYLFNRILVLRKGALVWGCVPSAL